MIQIRKDSAHALRALGVLATTILLCGCIRDVTSSDPVCTNSTARVGFVTAGETYKDTAVVLPGETFTKTWTLSNQSTDCVWDESIALVYASSLGARLSSATSRVAVEGVVKPSGKYSFSVEMKAPLAPGVYREDWRLVDQSNTLIPVGISPTIWVIIRVR